MKINWLMAGALAAIASCASADPLDYPGGRLDAHHPTGEVYDGAPRAGDQPAGPACQAARNYVDYVYGGRFDEIVTLFAEDAVVFWPMTAPDGAPIVQRLQGHEQIDSFYRNVIGRFRPSAVPVTFLGNDTDCMMEVAALGPVDGAMRYRLSAINHFTVDASGAVTRLISFQRSGLPRS